MNKVIILDVDGVAIKRAEVFSERFSREYMVPIENMLPFFRGVFAECLVGKADLNEALVPYMREWSWKKSVEELLIYWFEGEQEIDREVEDLVGRVRLKSVPVYLATNNETMRVEHLWEKVGLKNIFDGIFSSAGIGFKKPSVEFYSAVAKKISNDADIEIGFWDDDEKNVEGAILAGWKAKFYYGQKQFKLELEEFLGFKI